MNGFRNFFGNRYGIDNLNITLMVVALALSIISRFFPRSVLLPAPVSYTHLFTDSPSAPVSCAALGLFRFFQNSSIPFASS